MREVLTESAYLCKIKNKADSRQENRQSSAYLLASKSFF